MNPATAPAGLALVAFANQFANSVLTVYSGTQPATPETALSGNTALAAWTFTATPFTGTFPPAFGSGVDSVTANFSSASASPLATGTASFARATAASTAWVATTAYTRGKLVTNSSKLYVCTVSGTSAGSGGPTTSAYSIADNSCYWDYVGPSTVTVLADFTCGTSGTDIILGTTSIVTGTSITISSFNLQIAAV